MAESLTPVARIRELAEHAGIAPDPFVAKLKPEGVRELDNAITGLMHKTYDPRHMAPLLRAMHTAGFNPERIKNTLLQLAELKEKTKTPEEGGAKKGVGVGDVLSIISSAGNVTDLTAAYLGIGKLGAANIARKVITNRDDPSQVIPEVVEQVLSNIAKNESIAKRWAQYLDHPDKSVAWSMEINPATVQKLAGTLAATANDKKLIDFSIAMSKAGKNPEEMFDAAMKNEALMTQVFNTVATLLETAAQDSGILSYASRKSGISKDPVTQLVSLATAVCRDRESLLILSEFTRKPAETPEDPRLIVLLLRHRGKLQRFGKTALEHPKDIDRFAGRVETPEKRAAARDEMVKVFTMLRDLPATPEEVAAQIKALQNPRPPLAQPEPVPPAQDPSLITPQEAPAQTVIPQPPTQAEPVPPSPPAQDIQSPPVTPPGSTEPSEQGILGLVSLARKNPGTEAADNHPPVKLEEPVAEDRTAFRSKPSVNLGATAALTLGSAAAFVSQSSDRKNTQDATGTADKPEKTSFWSWKTAAGIVLAAGAVYAGYRTMTLPNKDGVSWMQRMTQRSGTSQQAGL